MYMAADLDGQNAEATLAHELDHALQDQHFDLKPHSKYAAGQERRAGGVRRARGGGCDEHDGRRAHGQGDAGEDRARPAGGRRSTQQVIESVSSGDGSERAARDANVARLAVRVRDGLRERVAAQRGWAAVDAAWNALPTTTEQILHVEKWRAHEPALDRRRRRRSRRSATAGTRPTRTRTGSSA